MTIEQCNLSLNFPKGIFFRFSLYIPSQPYAKVEYSIDLLHKPINLDELKMGLSNTIYYKI